MKIFCVSLGCDKNLVDTEMMLGLLNAKYFHIDSYSFLLLFLLDEKAISQHWETAFPIIITPQKQHPHPLEES